MLWSILKEASLNICHKIFTAVKQKLHVDTWMRLLQVTQLLSYPASQPLLAGSLPPHLCAPRRWRGFREPPMDWHVKGESVEDTGRPKRKNWKVCSGPHSEQIPYPLKLCFMVVGAGGWVGVSPKSPQPRPQAQKPREQKAMEKEGKSGRSVGRPMLSSGHGRRRVHRRPPGETTV